MRIRPGWVVFTLTALICAAGCEPQVGSDYQGEALAAKIAELESNGESVRDDTAAAIIWDLVSQGDLPPEPHAEFVSTTGDFPASFRLHVLQPPHPDLLQEMGDGNALAVAQILWVPADDFYEDDHGLGYHAVAREHVLVYVREAVAAGSTTARFLHGTPSAGYHIFEVDRPDPGLLPCATGHSPQDLAAMGAVDCPHNALMPAPEDMNTLISVTPGASPGDIYYEEFDGADAAEVLESPSTHE